MVTVADRPRLDAPPPDRVARLRAFLYRHRLFVGALALAFLLRVVTMLGYGPAQWFNDSYEYVSGAVNPDRPSALRPNGYSFLLLLLRPLHSFGLVAFVQHLMGLGVAVLIYSLLRVRFRLPGWGRRWPRCRCSSTRTRSSSNTWSCPTRCSCCWSWG